MKHLCQIRAHAEATGHTIPSLFDAAGVTYTQWWRWMNGKAQPTTRTMDRLMAVPVKPEKVEEDAAITWEELRALAERRGHPRPSAWATRKWEERQASAGAA